MLSLTALRHDLGNVVRRREDGTLETALVLFLGCCPRLHLVTSAVEAQCARCIQPPGEQVQCGNTFYNGANGCVISSPTRCDLLGSCEGQLGDECPNGNGVCPVDRWACGRPLREEWRLETYTIERPAARPASVARKTTKEKA